MAVPMAQSTKRKNKKILMPLFQDAMYMTSWIITVFESNTCWVYESQTEEFDFSRKVSSLTEQAPKGFLLDKIWILMDCYCKLLENRPINKSIQLVPHVFYTWAWVPTNYVVCDVLSTF